MDRLPVETVQGILLYLPVDNALVQVGWASMSLAHILFWDKHFAVRHVEAQQTLLQDPFLCNCSAFPVTYKAALLSISVHKNLYPSGSQFLHMLSLFEQYPLLYKVPLRNPYLLKFAATSGLFDGFRYLVDHGSDPAIEDSTPLILAALNGHADIVDLILKDGRADPGVSKSFPLRASASKGYAKIVELLIQDPRTDVATTDNSAFKLAASDGHLEVVQLLLNCPGVDPATSDSYGLRKASQGGYTQVVELLLKDGRSDAAAVDNYALSLAVQNGHKEVVGLLLMEPRVLATRDFTTVFSAATLTSRTDIVDVLLAAVRDKISDTALVAYDNKFSG
ncbi:hypothetical protein HDU81_003066 [Chytriomyces hyalinus]|nr:hypothetical protein HDU81_003066 [Chytriomyces hyalinus]